MNYYTSNLTDQCAKQSILVTGGVAPDPALLKGLRAAYPNALCYCADAGADLCYAAKLRPDCLIGDMDSLSAKTRQWFHEMDVPEMVYPAEKDYSDTQLAVEKLYEQGSDEVIVIGALGGRMDHELANIMLLVTYGRKGKSLVFWDDINRIRYVGAGQHHLDRVKDYVGIVPFSDDGMRLSIKGLYYPLDNTSVSFGASHLISNVFDKEDEAVIDIASGDGVLVLCHDRKKITKQ